MIHLEDGLIVGRGSERYCYRHPHDPRLCVKVKHNHRRKTSENDKDYAYFSRLERQGIDWSHLPRCHGWVETSEGRGLVFDFLQDEEGQALKSMKALLESSQVTLPQLKPALDELYAYFYRNRIFTSDLRESNVVCSSSDIAQPKLYVIDGVGNRDFVKLAERIPVLGRSKVKRQWQRFMARLEGTW